MNDKLARQCEIFQYRSPREKPSRVSHFQNQGVRIVHKPSGIVVSCHEYENVHKNRAKAFRLLAKKLAEPVDSDIEVPEVFGGGWRYPDWFCSHKGM